MTVPVLFRNHFQMGYVVRDMEKAIENLRTKFGVAQWRVLEMPPEAEVKCLGFAYVQSSMLELIEMRPGREIFFKPWIPQAAHALRLNHLGYMMGSEEEWNTVSKQFAAAGFQIAVSNSLGDVRFRYYDTVAELGHYCEITYLGPTAKDFFAAPRN
jgi:hypothetical protein